MSAAATIVRWSVPELELAPATSATEAVEVVELEPEQAPPPPTLEDIQAIQCQAYEAGHAEGFVDGQAQGYAQGEAQVRRLIAQIEGILDNFTRPLARLEGEVAAALGELAVRISGHLLGRAYTADPELLAALVTAALAAAGEVNRSVEVRLHPDDIAVLDTPLPRTIQPRGAESTPRSPLSWGESDCGDGTSVHLVPDPALSRGDVRVHADTLRIDGTLNARLDAALADVIQQAGERT